MLFDLAVIPLFIGVFAVYSLYRGSTRRISLSVFTDLRNIVHALTGERVPVRRRRLRRPPVLRLPGQSPSGKILAMCLVAVVAVPLARVVSFGLMGRAPDGSVPVIVVGHRQAGPDGGEPPAGPLQRQLRRLRRRQPARPQRRARRARGPPRPVPPLRRRPGGRLLLAYPPRADHRDAEGPVRQGRRLHRAPLLRADHQPLPRGGPVGPADDRHRPGVAVGRIPLPQAHVRRRGRRRSSWCSPSPFFLVIAVLIKSTSPGPVFFRQDRTGRNERPFSVLKFRTMYEDAEQRKAEIAPPQRDGRPAVQGHRRPPGHPARPVPAPDQPRRAAPAHQRLEGRHVPGRTPALRGRPRPPRSRAGPASASRPGRG